jgi:glycerate-2-kinase
VLFDRSPANPFPGPPSEGKGKDALHAVAFRAAVEGADAYGGVRSALRREGPTVRLGNRFAPIARFREIAFVALGHAAISAGYGAHDALGKALTQGYLAGPNAVPPEIPFRGTVVPPGRPGQPGADAALADVLELAQGLGPTDLLIVLVTPGAVVSLAAPPPGFDPSAWQGWLADLSGSGATSAEVADVVRALGQGGVGGRLAAAAGSAEVLPLVVDRGEGGVRVGGGPTVPVAPRERVAARAVLERLGKLASLAPAARALLAPDTSLPLGSGPKVHRPVAVAGPAEALRSAGDAITTRGYTSRLAAMSVSGGAAVAAGEFVDKADGVVTAALAGGAPKSKGVVAFAPGTLDVPEGDDERVAFAEFGRVASDRIRRRGMTVGVYQTSALAEPKGAAGIVVDAAGSGGPATPRPLAMRPGITDVGCLFVAFAPTESTS